MSKSRSKTADRTLALDAYVTALRRWAENAKANIQPEADALAKAARADLHKLAMKAVAKTFGAKAIKSINARRVRSVLQSDGEFHWSHYAPSIHREEEITVDFGPFKATLTLKVPESLREKWNPLLTDMFERFESIKRLPSPSNGSVRDWQRTAVRELMTDNPELVEKVIVVIGEAAAKTSPDHWTAKVARAGQRTKRAPSRRR